MGFTLEPARRAGTSLPAVSRSRERFASVYRPVVSGNTDARWDLGRRLTIRSGRSFTLTAPQDFRWFEGRFKNDNLTGLNVSLDPKAKRAVITVNDPKPYLFEKSPLLGGLDPLAHHMLTGVVEEIRATHSLGDYQIVLRTNDEKLIAVAIRSGLFPLARLASSDSLPEPVGALLGWVTNNSAAAVRIPLIDFIGYQPPQAVETAAA